MAGSDRYHEKETDDRDAAGRRAGLAAIAAAGAVVMHRKRQRVG